MPYRKNNKKSYRRKRPNRKMNYSNLIKTIKKVDTRQEFKRAPMLRSEFSKEGTIISPQILSSNAAIQCPFQDIPLGVGVNLDKNQRFGSEIYPQVLKFNGTLQRKTGSSDIQRFRVMVLRYAGEMDFSVLNSSNNGFELMNDQWAHICKPGQVWSAKPYIKNQVKVMYDKTYVVNDSNKSGVVVNLSVPIKRKLTYETTSSGAAAVGAGQIVLAIASDLDWNLANYYTYGFYKDLQ